MSSRYQVIIQSEAEQGIKEAYLWVSNYSPRQARSWLEGLYKLILSLEQMPLRCSLAFENDFFEEEIRLLIYGRGNNTYKILMNYPTLLCEDGVSKFPSSTVCFLRFFEPSCCIPPQ